MFLVDALIGNAEVGIYLQVIAKAEYYSISDPWYKNIQF